MAKGRSKCCVCVLFVLFVLGVGLLISGIIVAVLKSFTSLADDEIKKGVPLKKDSTSFENWEKPDGDLFIEYYFFNITNEGNGGKLPEMIQVGPYTYRRKPTTNNVTRLGQTLTYEPTTQYHYDPSRSCASCDPIKDRIKTVNYPLLVILRGIQANLAKNDNASQVAIQAATVDFLLKKQAIGLFQERSVNEFLWGYSDIVFSTVAGQLTMQNISPTTLYALQFNNSGSGLTKIHTGEHDVDRVAEYIEWMKYKTLPWWSTPSANMLNGTGGIRFRPFIEKDDELYVFVTEICRSLKIAYESTVTVHGIDLYRFTPPKEVFSNGDINPDNKGFCVTGPKKVCLPSGLLDVNLCKGGAKAPPFVASTPNFYDGDPLLAQTFKLVPKKEEHATFIDIEPNTGVTMQGHKRLQLNFAIPRSLNIKNIILNVNTSDLLFIPAFFTDEFAKISEEDADDFKKKVLLPLRVAMIMPYVMISLGALLLIIAIIVIITRRLSTVKTRSSANGELGTENYSM